MRPFDAAEAALRIMGDPQKREAILKPESRPRFIQEAAPELPAHLADIAGSHLYALLLREMDRRLRLRATPGMETAPSLEIPHSGRTDALGMASNQGAGGSGGKPLAGGGGPRQGGRTERTIEQPSEMGARLPKPPGV